MADLALDIININFNGEKQISLINNLIMQLMMQYDLSCSLKGLQLCAKFKDNKIRASVINQIVEKQSELIKVKFSKLYDAVKLFNEKLKTIVILPESKPSYQRLIAFLEEVLNAAQSQNSWIEIAGDGIFFEHKYAELKKTTHEILSTPRFSEGYAFLELMSALDNLQNKFIWKENASNLLRESGDKNKAKTMIVDSEEEENGLYNRNSL